MPKKGRSLRVGDTILERKETANTNRKGKILEVHTSPRSFKVQWEGEEQPQDNVKPANVKVFVAAPPGAPHPADVHHIQQILK